MGAENGAVFKLTPGEVHPTWWVKWTGKVQRKIGANMKQDFQLLRQDAEQLVRTEWPDINEQQEKGRFDQAVREEMEQLRSANPDRIRFDRIPPAMFVMFECRALQRRIAERNAAAAAARARREAGRQQTGAEQVKSEDGRADEPAASEVDEEQGDADEKAEEPQRPRSADVDDHVVVEAADSDDDLPSAQPDRRPRQRAGHPLPPVHL